MAFDRREMTDEQKGELDRQSLRASLSASLESRAVNRFELIPAPVPDAICLTLGASIIADLMRPDADEDEKAAAADVYVEIFGGFILTRDVARQLAERLKAFADDE